MKLTYKGGVNLKKVIVLNTADNIANAIVDIKKGDKVDVLRGDENLKFDALDDIPFGFKVAVTFIEKNQDIIKYGEIIGKASENISRGDLVHIHNMEGNRGRGDLEV